MSFPSIFLKMAKTIPVRATPAERLRAASRAIGHELIIVGSEEIQCLSCELRCRLPSLEQGTKSTDPADQWLFHFGGCLLAMILWHSGREAFDPRSGYMYSWKD